MDIQVIQSKIYEIRNYRVMLDIDLADMYDVKTKALKQAVRRNPSRFPSDFMFELTKDEWAKVVTNCDHPLKYSYIAPFAFTEQGVAMLSSILRSDTAINVNIIIMRAFVRMRELAMGYAELKRQLEEYQLDTTLQIAEILDILNEMAEQKRLADKPRNPIGFRKDI
ncbi:MAG: ORF6N domain-containing protein [Bacteroidales bacterium]|jgi:hypothetical protein|nr:ORF6N domain-containing protein [Bacteroidales bacterium]